MSVYTRGVEPPAPPTLGERMKLLADRFHGGSVRRMALTVGVPPSTLAAIVTGQIAHPSTRVVEQLADWHQTSTDWLLRGTGRGPLARFRPISAEAAQAGAEAAGRAFAWEHLVASLGELPDGTREALLALPSRDLHRVGSEWGLVGEHGDGPVWYYRAVTQAYDAYLTLLRGWLERDGAEVVGRMLLGTYPEPTGNRAPSARLAHSRRKQ